MFFFLCIRLVWLTGVGFRSSAEDGVAPGVLLFFFLLVCMILIVIRKSPLELIIMHAILVCYVNINSRSQKKPVHWTELANTDTDEAETCVLLYRNIAYNARTMRA